MRCTKVKKSLSAYLKGELPGDAGERIGKHLKGCPCCSGELSALEKLEATLDRLAQISPSPGFEARFLRRLEGAEKGRMLHDWMSGLAWSFNMKMGLSTALLVSLMFGGYLFLGPFTGYDRAGKEDLSVEMAEIAAEISNDIDFYRSYDMLKELDVLMQLEKDDRAPENAHSAPNRVL
jgi:hypothetical protein